MSPNLRLYSASVYAVTTRKNSPSPNKHARRTSKGPCAVHLAAANKENMPYDSSKTNAKDHNNNAAARPLMPSLASNRTARSPLTPRLATQHQNVQSGANVAVSATPLLKKPARSELGSAKSTSNLKDEPFTPV